MRPYRKLQSTVGMKKDKLCMEFVSELLHKDTKIDFENYLKAIEKKISEK